MNKLPLIIGATLAAFLTLAFWPGLAHLLFGWAIFLWRVLPRVSVDRPSVAVGVMALLLFTGGIHLAGGAWARRASLQLGERTWPGRWSLTVTAGVVLLFTAGICLVAIVHQVVWLLGSREPRYVQTMKHLSGTTSATNLRSVCLAISNYNDANGCLPPGGTFGPDGSMRHGWASHILPYLPYWGEIDFQSPWNSPRNEAYFKCLIPEFLNPDMPGAPLFDTQGFGLSHYAANSGVFSAKTPLRGMKRLTNTLLVGEVNSAFKPWAHPINWRDPAKGINQSPDGFGGPPGSGGANFVTGGGEVRFLSNGTSREVLKELSVPAAGGETDPGVPESRP
jgi:hypothetical protein